ncbi:YraN family protein [Candidatus Aerophobetes bacterium]|nr:YraN family protein [Candidatus Aerophobetes bacterium]
MPQDKRAELGKKGEKAALSFLRKKGYKILERNFRCRLGEIDIVAKNEDKIIFVEVRSRENLNLGYPEESLTHIKKKRLTKLALFYLKCRRLEDIPCRFDVVAVVFEKGEIKNIHLVKNAFEASF